MQARHPLIPCQDEASSFIPAFAMRLSILSCKQGWAVCPVQDDLDVHQGSALGGSGRPIVDPMVEETSTSGQQQGYTHFLCVSPDAPTNPVLYWLGNFDSKTSSFLLDKAKGPLQLDLGDILYAPNLMVDDKVTFCCASGVCAAQYSCFAKSVVSLSAHVRPKAAS